jgi:predicted XRE-type DNA-binding protein
MKKKKQRTHEEELADERVEIGYGSIYEQLGYKDYKEMETKATLVMEISKAIKKKKMTQTICAKILGISQPKLSELLNGHFRGYSVERLIHFLNELGKDVDIVVRTKPRNRKARVKVYHSNTEIVPNVPMAAKGSKH